jgi:hypothetical protein
MVGEYSFGERATENVAVEKDEYDLDVDAIADILEE